MTADPKSKILLGVSACLLGDEVRYDGRVDTLAEHFAFVKVCPEEEIGMGTPRETVRLVGRRNDPRMVAPGSSKDWTSRMNSWAARRARQLGAEDLSGYIFKSRSPSCGVFQVKVYNAKGNLGDPGSGLFAMEMMRRYPLLPIEEEGRLNDAWLRENFIERVFAYHRLKSLFTGRWKREELVDFHAREKYLLMAHNPTGLKKLDQLVARVKSHSPAEFRDLYMAGFMGVMAQAATVKKHAAVLKKLTGCLRSHLGAEERRLVLASIADYRRDLVPLVVPMTILKHHLELHKMDDAGHQTYLNPHPCELKLRNHV